MMAAAGRRTALDDRKRTVRSIPVRTVRFGAPQGRQARQAMARTVRFGVPGPVGPTCNSPNRQVGDRVRNSEFEVRRTDTFRAIHGAALRLRVSNVSALRASADRRGLQPRSDDRGYCLTALPGLGRPMLRIGARSQRAAFDAAA